MQALCPFGRVNIFQPVQKTLDTFLKVYYILRSLKQQTVGKPTSQWALPAFQK
jgi:hypothetical protein